MKILIVDDDDLMHLTFKNIFPGEELTFAKSMADALTALSHETFAAAFLDIQLEKGEPGDGIELLRKIREKDSYLPCIMISAIDDRETVAKCLEWGAVDYVAKGTVAPGAYLIALHKASNWRKLLAESPVGRTPSRSLLNALSAIRGQSPLISDLKETIKKMGNLSGPFLILGETGSGKELVARALWSGMGDEKRPFIAINCASLPASLVESELFGYEKGAFTGAVTTRTGLFEAANGGDIFLDEIGELPKETQAKFLRVLQEKRVRRLGSDKERPLNVRIIAATHNDLPESVHQGEFREDLFYRLNVHQLRVPSLRERNGDILELLHIFLNEEGLAEVKIDASAAQSLVEFFWPGNVRQLKAFAQHIKPYLTTSITADLVDRWMQLNRVRNKSSDNLHEKALQDLRMARSSGNALNIVSLTEDFQKAYVQGALELTEQNRSQAARLLGVSRQRLSNWLNEWNIF